MRKPPLQRNQTRIHRPPVGSRVRSPSLPFRVHWAVFSTGERFPVLLRSETGLPAFLPTVFAARQRGSKAANTLDLCLRAVLVLFAFAEAEGIDIAERISSGKLLDLWELDRFADATHRPLRGLLHNDTPSKPTARRSHSLEHVRARLPQPAPSVSLTCVATRLLYAHQYFDWCTRRRAGELLDKPTAHRAYLSARDEFLQRLKARIPDVGHRTSEREGLSLEVLARIPSVIDPNSGSNPWKLTSARIRNQLLILWLVHLGERHGEVLGTRVEDVDIGRSEVRVVRRPDSPDDPRRRQPTAKTDGRPLPLIGLEEATEHYVLAVRPTIPNATTHPFLFVDVRCGRPLSSSALAKVLRQLGEAIGAPGVLTPHVLRHSWNDAFSRHADEIGVSEQAEADIRNYLQGWSEGSRTAQVYTRRHVREAATAALEKMNTRLLAKGRPP